MKKKIVGLVLVLVLLITLIYIGVRQNPTDPNTKDKVKIGAIYPMTGLAASFGEEFLRGANLAVKSAQARGVNVELIVEDGKTDPKASIAAYNSLKLRGVRMMLTTISATSLPLIPLADTDEVLLFADVAHPDVSGASPYVFRHSSTAEQEAEVMFNYLQEQENAKKVGLIWMNDDYGSAFYKYFISLVNSVPGMSLVEAGFGRETRDLRPTAQRILSKEPDVIIVVSFGTPMGLAIKAIREQGFTGTLMASMGLSLTADAANAAGETVKGVIHTYIFFDHEDHEFKEYQKAFTETYDRAPQDFSTLAHNSTLLLIHLIEKGITDTTEQIQYLKSLKEFDAPGEKMRILETGDILPPVKLKEWK